MAQEKPNLVFLMETKNKEEVVNRVRKSLYFQNMAVVNPVGIAGGLAILWNEDVKIKVEESSQALFNLKCRVMDCGTLMRVTFLHAPNDFQQREGLWQKLRKVKGANQLPWLCIGDFNEIMYHWEK